MKDKKIILTVRVSAELEEKIRLAMQFSGKDQSEIVRRSIELGLSELELIGYNEDAAVRAAILAAKAAAVKDPEAANSLAKPQSTEPPATSDSIGNCSPVDVKQPIRRFRKRP
jgi:predicted DNA-binding protein